MCPRILRHQAFFALAVLAALLLAASPALAVSQTRVGSADTVLTAVRVSKLSYPAEAPAVVFAGNWHDQLCGSALAGAVKGPMLLGAHDLLPADALAELKRLRSRRAYLVGHYSRAAVAQAKAAMPAGSEIVRIAGPDAADTSRLVAEKVSALRGSRPERILVVSITRRDLACALAAPAAARAWPVVLYDGDDRGLPARVARSVEASSALIIGGSKVVGSTAHRALMAALGADSVQAREYGDAYETSWGVAKWSAMRAGMDFEQPVFVTASKSANRITAGMLAAKRGSPVITLPSGSIPAWLANRLFNRRRMVRSVAFVGEVPSLRRTDVKHALKARLFSTSSAMRHVRALTRIGPRKAGSSAERRGADYIASKLRSYGYSVRTQTVSLPKGRMSQNVIAEKRGRSSKVIVLGAHMDTKPPSPGGNDNASGVAVTLELARVLSEGDVAPTVRFIAFGAEEIGGPTPDDHHFGSRQYVSRLTSSQRRRIESMVSIDMVGYGRVFNIRNLRKAPMTTVRSMRSWGRYTGQSIPYLKDPSRTGWSDHEAFEFKGIPVAWLEWRNDPDYHTVRDTYRHIQPSRVGRTGRLTRGWLLDLTPAEVGALRP